MQLELVIERFSTNKLGKADEQRKEIAGAANKRTSCPGVVGKATKMVGPVEELDDYDHSRQRYSFSVVLEKATFKSEDAAVKHLEIARKFVEKAAEARGWTVKGEINDVEERKIAADSRPDFVVPDLTPSVMKEYFGKIKERAAHIRLIHQSTVTYRETNGEERNHTLLYGEAATCKSTVFEQLKKWYESDNTVERVMRVNATTLSKAGLESLLLERAEANMLPECLWINELEKGEASDFHCLLSIMDGMGEISRLNTRVGRRQAKCSLLIWADANDSERVKNWMSGALWSRFVKRYPCVRPTRDVMLEILIERIDERIKRGRPGNRLWAKAAVDYCYDVARTDDPREILSMLDGGDGLLTGSYFKDLEAIKMAEEISKQQKQLMK